MKDGLQAQSRLFGKTTARQRTITAIVGNE
jgi:hypothetical protein